MDRAIVVGAGPIGAVLALALRQRNVPVLLIEALAEPQIECRAASCHPPTIAMLDELGLLEAGLEQGLVSPVFHYLDRPTGALVGRFDLGAMREPPAHPYVLQWEQYKIVLTVLERLAADAGAEIRRSTRATGVAQDEDRVRVTLEGPDGEVSTVEGRYLIGCDGGRSTVRKLAEIPFDGFTWPERFLKIDTHFDFFGLREDITNRNYFSDPDEWMNLFKARGPDGAGMWRAVSPTTPEQTEAELMSPEGVQSRLQKFCPNPSDYEISTVALYNVHQRVAETFNKGRILLAGDAAHVNNPVGGMGMNGGIHDAVNLAGKLAAIWFEGAEAQPLLDRYSRQRRKAQIDGVQAQSIQNKQTLGEKDPVIRQAKLDAIHAQSLDPEQHDAYIRRACMIDSYAAAEATL